MAIEKNYDTLTLFVNGKPVFSVEGPNLHLARDKFISHMIMSGNRLIETGLKNDDMNKIRTIRVPYDYEVEVEEDV